jgi:predicted dehydrogenase
MRKLTASVVGGGTGGQLSLEALERSNCYDLVAAADLQPSICDQLKELYPGIQTFSNHKEMFAQCPTDVVCVSTYPPSHEKVTMDALQLPLKGILVEKPLGHTVKSGRKILETIKQIGIPIVVPHGLLVKKTPLEIIDRVQKGEIGQLKLVEIQNTKWDAINAGIHWLNFFVSLTRNESFDCVMAIFESSTRTYRDGMQVETTGVTYAQTNSGIRVVMNTGDDVLVNREQKDTLFRIIGTRGQIEFWGWENSYHILNDEWPAGKEISPDEFPVTGHQKHLEQLAQMIHSEQVDYRLAESSLIALEVIEGAYISSINRCKVTFPVDEFIVPEENKWYPGTPYSGVGGGRDGRKLG